MTEKGSVVEALKAIVEADGKVNIPLHEGQPTNVATNIARSALPLAEAMERVVEAAKHVRDVEQDCGLWLDVVNDATNLDIYRAHAALDDALDSLEEEAST